MFRLVILSLMFVAGPLAAQAQERALTDAEVLDLADRQILWCENWSDATRDCESLYLLRREADGTLIRAGMFLLTEDPDVQITVAQIVTLEHGRLCAAGSTDDQTILATLDGRSSPEMSAVARVILTESMAEYAEAAICQQLFSQGDPDALGEIITADDIRLYDFESTSRLGRIDSGFLLRPVLGDEPEEGFTDL